MTAKRPADGWELPREEPTWDGPHHGTFGVLAGDPDGDTVQCHICGDWYALLGAHAHHTHGLLAVDYRRAFGLRQSTALASSGYRANRRRHSKHLVTPERLQAIRAAANDLSPQEMRRRSRMKRRRRQHDLETWTEPTRTARALTARYGTPTGYPIQEIQGFARDFVDELNKGQRGVYARLGERWGVGWPTARSRVMAAVNRQQLVWTGHNHAPNAHLPGHQPPDPPPGSFDDRLQLLHSWYSEHGTSHVPRGTLYEGVKLRSWMDSQRQRYRRGTLTSQQANALQQIIDWWWHTPAPKGRRADQKPT